MGAVEGSAFSYIFSGYTPVYLAATVSLGLLLTGVLVSFYLYFKRIDPYTSLTMITTKRIRIKSFILHDEEIWDRATMEKFEKLPKPSKKELEEEDAAINVPFLRMELGTKIVEMNISEENYNALCYIFRLYGIPLKPIENGIEVDVREKEPYTHRTRLSE